MLYRNKNTGALVDVKSKLSGAWEAVNPPETPDTAEKTVKKRRTRSKADDDE